MTALEKAAAAVSFALGGSATPEECDATARAVLMAVRAEADSGYDDEPVGYWLDGILNEEPK